MHAALRHMMQDLYTTARTLAAVVVPHEYGLDPQGKLHIGSKICCELLAKLLADLDSMQVNGGGEGGACVFSYASDHILQAMLTQLGEASSG